MRRPPALALAAVTALILLLAACATTAAPPASTGAPTPTPMAPVDSPDADPTPAGSDAPTAPPAPSWTGHPAEGLAIVLPDAPDNPVTNIHIVEADGSLRPVTGLSNRLGASRPAWFHDGTRLAFSGPKFGEATIHGQVGVVNADGTGERQIGQGAFPQWSPDGTRVAFTEVDDVTGEDLSFYVVDVASGEITDLGLGHQPRWLGNDRLLFNANSYAANGVASFALYVLDLATGEREHVADWAYAVTAPDGASYVRGVEQELTLVAADGTELAALGTGFDPVWSPDGTLLAIGYEIDNDANPVYAVVDLEGNPIASGIHGSSPTFSPDGTRLAVEVYRASGPIVQVVELASGSVIWEAEGAQPAWRP